MPDRASLAGVWPAIGIASVVCAGLAWIWFSGPDRIQQERVTSSAGLLFAGALALALWALFFAGWSARTKVRGLAAVIVSVGIFLVVFRYRGVSGDLVPQFELRFRSRAADLPESARGSLPGARPFPQFLGPNRDGRLPGIELAADWEARPPVVLWRRPVGRGWSGFSVSGVSAVTHEQHAAEERVVSYELATGKVLWASREVARYENALAGEGPRATPTIDGGRVYAVGGTGILTALDLRTGERLWKRDVLADSGGRLPAWGKSNSPLVLESELVVVSAGGTGSSLVAYRAADGEIAWRGGEDASAYTSPVLVELAGVPQIVTVNHASITGHDPEDGTVLWSRPWPSSQPTVAQPLPLPGDRLLVSAGYGVGSKLFRIRRGASGELASELVWESIRLKSKFANLVFHDGFVYGLDDGILVCLDPETGRRRWKGGRYGHGQLLLAGEHLLVQGEQGEIVLVAPSPDELRELGRFRILDQKIWNPPALAGPYLLARNDAEAVLVELPLSHGP